jgi:hypothetical protein
LQHEGAVAAGACAQAMLGLPNHATILDLLALSPELVGN